MTTQVGALHKKTIVKDMRGNIVSLRDEANGGWIVRNRQVVNQDLWNAYLKKQQDIADAAKAMTAPKIRQDYPESKEGAPQPNQLEARVDKMEETLAAILKAVQK
jgi:hypothetical protein